MPKVTIIIPVYNVETYIKQCIESVIIQTLSDIEIICVDDGSTDSSAQILDEYAKDDSRIKVIHKENSGYGHSMNIGLQNASGEFIGIVESDDFVAADMFETLYNAATEHNAEVIKSNYYTYNKEQSTFVEVLGKLEYNRILTPLDNLQLFLTTPSIWSAIYKKSFLEQNDIWFHETPGASYQDTSFIFKVLASASRVLLRNEAFLYYRTDNLDSSVKSPTKVFCLCDEFREIDLYINNRLQNKNEFKAIEAVVKYERYRWNYNRLSVAYQYAFLMQFVKEFQEARDMGYLQKKYWEDFKWENLQSLLDNPNQFYKMTAKDDFDSRLSTYTQNNLQIYRCGLIRHIQQFEQIIIYGAGVIGQRVAGLLTQGKEPFDIKCFAVSDQNDNPAAIMDIPVSCIYDLIEYAKNSLIFVAVKERNQYDIVKLLKELGFPNIILVDSFFLMLMEQ